MPRYQAYYCEENAWQLAQDLGERGRVLLITNPAKRVAMWCQKMSPSPDQPIVWDYHAVNLARTDAGEMVHDLDSVLPRPVELQRWARESFREAPPAFAPRFVLIDGPRFAQTFASDRSHMRSPEGHWLAPPPPWPAPLPDAARTASLQALLGPAPPIGQVLGLTELLALHGP